jgi:hypothetical protein
VEFPLMSKSEACQRLGIESKRVRFLLFGSITERKGINLVVDSYTAMASVETELAVVGEWHDSLNGNRCKDVLRKLTARGLARHHSCYVPERDVSAWFCAADYVLCAYPSTFDVSSGTFTRACAAARPVITGSHGVLGRMVQAEGCGLTYETGSVRMLTATLRHALKVAETPEAWRMGQAGQGIAAQRTLAQYGGCLLRAYSESLAEKKRQS